MWWSDYFADTRSLSGDEHGAYLQLIGEYWMNGGPLVDDDGELARSCNFSAQKWKKISTKVKKYFIKKDGLLIHNRIETELEKARKKSEKARASAMQRHHGSNANAMRTQCITRTRTRTN